MQAVRENVGGAELLIQATDVEVIGEPLDKFGTSTTARPEDIIDVYDRAKSIIKEIAEDIGCEMDKLGQDVKGPSSLEMQFRLGFSAKANAWFLSAGAEYALAVTMVWDFGGDDE